MFSSEWNANSHESLQLNSEVLSFDSWLSYFTPRSFNYNNLFLTEAYAKYCIVPSAQTLLITCQSDKPLLLVRPNVWQFKVNFYMLHQHGRIPLPLDSQKSQPQYYTNFILLHIYGIWLANIGKSLDSGLIKLPFGLIHFW